MVHRSYKIGHSSRACDGRCGVVSGPQTTFRLTYVERGKFSVIIIITHFEEGGKGLRT